MSEVEFEQLLDTVRTAIKVAPQEDFLTARQAANQPQKAANDNDLIWPFIPSIS